VGGTSHEFWSSVRHNWHDYSAFITSFVVIALAWVQHRRIWSYADRFSSRQLYVNLVWLFTIVLFPFATSLLHPSGHQTLTTHAYRFGFYALLEVIDDAAILIIAREIVVGSLYRSEGDREKIERNYWTCYGVILGFGLSIPVFFAVRWAWVLWIVGPLAVSRFAERRSRQKENR
jgi:uncharacterized membrane protein